MERLKCSLRTVTDDDRSMLALIAEETLHPLAEGAGHPERYHPDELMDLLDRAEVVVAESERRGGRVHGRRGQGRRAPRGLRVRGPGLRGPRRGQPAARLGRGHGHRPGRREAHRVRAGRRPPVPAPVRGPRLRGGHRRTTRCWRWRSACRTSRPEPVRVTLVAVPYDLGREGVGSGHGPGAYLAEGVTEALADRGHDVEVVTAQRSGPFERRAAGRPGGRRGRRRAGRGGRAARQAAHGAGRQLQRHAGRAGRPAGRGRAGPARASPPSGSTPTATSTRRTSARRATWTACRWPCSRDAPSPRPGRGSAARRRRSAWCCTPAAATSTARRPTRSPCPACWW